MKKPWKVLVKIKTLKYPGYGWHTSYEAMTKKGAEKWLAKNRSDTHEYQIQYRP